MGRGGGVTGKVVKGRRGRKRKGWVDSEPYLESIRQMHYWRISFEVPCRGKISQSQTPLIFSNASPTKSGGREAVDNVRRGKWNGSTGNEDGGEGE